MLKKYDYSKYATNNLYKELMKDSIDYAIENANNYNEFISIMNNLDYEIMIRNDDLSIRRKPYKRSTRILKQFGENYSLDNVKKRILEEQSFIYIIRGILYIYIFYIKSTQKSI